MKTILRMLWIPAAVLCGCTATAPQWEKNFGESVRQARAAQVIDPDAARRNTKAPVIDSKATAGAQTGYATSYGYAVKEAKPPAITLVPAGQ